MFGHDFNASKVNFYPALHAQIAKVEGAITLPIYRNTPQRLALDISGKKAGASNILRVADDWKVAVASKDAIQISVVRPDDLVHLNFEFVNCKYQKREQFTFVVKDKDKKPAYMVVYFQAQHQLEQAYFETNGLPGGNNGNETPTLPAKFIRAGMSRLVFELPEAWRGIPLTMNSLLDWSPYTLKINYRARADEHQIQNNAHGSFLHSGEKVQSNASKDMPGEISESIKRKWKHVPDTSLRILRDPKSKLLRQAVYDQSFLKTKVEVQAQPVDSKKIAKAIQSALLKMGMPDPLETSIEAPTRLYISPNQMAAFAHLLDVEEKDVVTNPVYNPNQLQINDPLSTSAGKVIELWHSRLGIKLKSGKIDESALHYLKTIRALWAADARLKLEDKPPRNLPFRAALDGRDRHNIVHQSSNYNIKNYKPKPVTANRLYLTALGAYIDFYGNFHGPGFDANPNLDLLLWEHRANLGRDNYVKIVEAGYLFPFGHMASLVKITERKWHDTRTAVMRQRMFVVVTQPEVLYQPRDASNNFIPFPFISIIIRTTQTPNIDAPKSIRNWGGDYNFWIETDGQPFDFQLEVTDKDGLVNELHLPLIFVGKNVANNGSRCEELSEAYAFDGSRTTSDARGQKYAYAESLVPADTHFSTVDIRFAAEKSGNNSAINFRPLMYSANVFVEAVEEMTGEKSAVTIALHDDDNNAGVFANITGSLMLDFNGDTDKSGGSLSPNAQLTALSKLQGPVGGKVDEIANLDFNPSEFFNSDMSKGGVAKLFGVIDIFELLFGGIDIKSESADLKNSLGNFGADIEGYKLQIEELRSDLKDAADNAKAAIEAQIDNVKNQLQGAVDGLKQTLDDTVPRIPNLKTYETEEAFVAEYRWVPELEKEKDLFGVLHFEVVDEKNAFSVVTQMTRPFDTSKPSTVSVASSLDKFYIEIADMIGVRFEYFRFSTKPGESTKVQVRLDQVEAVVFLGPLAFVNNLQNLIPMDGFDNGPYINLQPNGIKAGFDIGVPNVEVGMLSIANITLGAYAHLPFTGAPLAIGFNFCKRENPFLLTVSCFGGGGFFLMETTIKGFRMIEAAFEFGAAISFNVGVASGGVSIMGGFYFKLEIIEDNTITQLTGYIRINGALSILGLITLSMEFYLALTYIIESGKAGKLYGEATLMVKVEILFFSKSVSMTVRRTLKGADADPKFGQMIEEPDWLQYCSAFAA